MNIKNISKQPRYNLNLVIQETGLKPDALRAWEKRYQLPQPDRSKGGHRLYSDYDIQLIKWLQARIREGMRISQAAAYWKELDSSGENPLDIVNSGNVNQSSNQDSRLSKQTLLELRNDWISHCLMFDEKMAEQTLSKAFAQFPIETVCTNLISTSLSMIGDLWYTGEASVQQEHFASELALRKIHTLISTAPRPIHDKIIMICSPAGEIHSVPILIINLLLKYRGWETLYLGSNVPLDHLEDTIHDTRPDLVVFSATRLPAAGAMLDSIQLVNKLQVPSAFGGRIFSQVIELIDLIPGHYLGTDLNLSILTIEHLISNPNLKQGIEFKSLTKLLQQYKAKQNRIQSEIIDHYSDEKFSRIQDDIRDANLFLSEEISTGLTFGDLDFINADLYWLAGLLQNRKINSELLNSYYKIYASAVENNLGEMGNRISKWLRSKIK